MPIIALTVGPPPWFFLGMNWIEGSNAFESSRHYKHNSKLTRIVSTSRSAHPSCFPKSRWVGPPLSPYWRKCTFIGCGSEPLTPTANSGQLPTKENSPNDDLRKHWTRPTSHVDAGTCRTCKARCPARGTPTGLHPEIGRCESTSRGSSNPGHRDVPTPYRWRQVAGL